MDLRKENSTDELMKAQALLWTHIFNHIDSMSLKCAVELGIPTAIHNHGKPISISELLSVLSLSPSKSSHLRRLMRMLTHSGIFSENEENMYSLTPVSSILVQNKSLGLSGFLLVALHPFLVNPFQSMSAWFKSDGEPTPFSVEYGCDLWEMTERNLKFNKVFNEGMASDSNFLMNVFLEECGHVFEGLKSLVDVGGGTGSTAMAIAEAFPTVSCSVLELPQVVSTVKEKGCVEFIAGDMFDYIPPADAVLLKWILHDWNDEKCVSILKRCKEAIISREDGGGKVIIIDVVMGSNKCYEKLNTSQIYMDMLMMVLCNGAERGEQEWEKIFIDSGFKDYKITPTLGLRSVIEVYP